MSITLEYGTRISKIDTNYLLTFVFLFFIGLSTSAQKTTIKARVTTFDVIAVMQAEVSAKKSKTIVITDSLGQFTIEADLKDKLVIKAIGFKPKTIKVKKLKGVQKINIEIAGSEDEVDIAVANGHINRSRAAEARKLHNTEKPYAYGFTTMRELLVAKFPHFKFVGDEVIIRGRNALNEENEKGALFVLNGSTYNWGRIRGFEVRLVKNIKILTGTAATRYGSGSSNGVLKIELVSD